jgi:hypothetical protein
VTATYKCGGTFVGKGTFGDFFTFAVAANPGILFRSSVQNGISFDMRKGFLPTLTAKQRKKPLRIRYIKGLEGF